MKGIPAPNRSIPLWTKITFSISLFAIALLILDRVISPFLRKPFTVPHSRTILYDTTDLYAGGKTIQYVRDQYGLRGASGGPESIDIVTLGGSTTDQRYIAEEKTWQAALERELARDGIQLKVANAGIDGQSTVGNIVNFHSWFPDVPGFAPKYYLIYAGINDMWIEEGNGRSEYNSNTFGGKERSIVAGTIRRMHGRHKIKKLNLGHGKVDFASVEWTTEGLLNPRPESYRTRLREYGQRLGILRELSLQQNATPIYVTQFARTYRIENDILTGVEAAVKGGLNGIDYHRVLSLFNSATLEFCKKTRSLCIETSTLPLLDSDFYDWTHMTPQGTEKFGKFLARKLATHLATGP